MLVSAQFWEPVMKTLKDKCDYSGSESSVWPAPEAASSPRLSGYTSGGLQVLKTGTASYQVLMVLHSQKDGERRGHRCGKTVFSLTHLAAPERRFVNCIALNTELPDCMLMGAFMVDESMRKGSRNHDSL